MYSPNFICLLICLFVSLFIYKALSISRILLLLYFVKDYHGQADQPTSVDNLATSKVTGNNPDTSLPKFAALVSGPVIMGVGDTPVKDISSVAVTHLDPGAHVDGYGEHGHFGKDPVVHTPDGRFVPIDSPFGQTKQKTGKGFPIGVPAKLIGSHQDHHTRTTVKHIGTHIEHMPKLPGVTRLDPGDHIDFHGEDDNLSGKPVLHKADGRRLPLDSAVGSAIPQTGAGHQIDASATHLGIPRKHVQKPQGLPNIDPDPHIDALVTHAGTLIGVPHLDSAPTLPGVTRLDRGDHIDFHGVHDNLSGKPVLHKADRRRVPMHSAVRQIDLHAVGHVAKLPTATKQDPGDHIDPHGKHGNFGKDPVLHTAGGKRFVVDPLFGDIDPHAVPVKKPAVSFKKHPVSRLPPGSHIDPPQVHGNTHNVPVIHTPDGKHVHLGRARGHTIDKSVTGGDTNLIGVSHLGDIDPHAVPVKRLPGVPRLPPGSHIVPPEVHGNTHNVPVIHTPDGKHVHLGHARGHTIDKSVTRVGPNLIGVSRLGDKDSHSVLMNKLPEVSQLPPGSHIDPPKLHGNTHNVPVIHTPDGKHVHLRRARGHTIDKSVTGVNLKRMPDTVIDLPQTVVVTKEVPDLPPHTHIKPDLLPVDRPLAHIKPEFPEVDGPFKIIKPDIPSVDTIPDLFSTESAVHPTEHMSHRGIVPELSAPIKKHNSKQALNKQIRRRKQLQSAGQIANRWQNLRLQQQRRQKLEKNGSRSRRKFPKPSRRPLKPARRIRPQKNLGGIVKNIFQRMHGRRGGGRGRGRVRPARFRQGRRRRGRRGRQRRFRRDHE